MAMAGMKRRNQMFDQLFQTIWSALLEALAASVFQIITGMFGAGIPAA